MIRSLYYKFILSYVIFGLLGFLVIGFFSSNATYEYLLQEKADLLYDEANQLALDCSQTPGWGLLPSPPHAPLFIFPVFCPVS